MFGGGSGNNSIIDFVTTATTGNAQDFGDLATGSAASFGMSSPIRGLFAGGNTPGVTNRIEFITIQTTGNGTDFGDITTATSGAASFSNGHGGL